MVDKDQTPCYVAHCKCGCGALVFASVDDGTHDAKRRKENANEIAKLIRDGLVVTRMTVDEVRKSKFLCDRKKASA
jgi:hypothetical protein